MKLIHHYKIKPVYNKQCEMKYLVDGINTKHHYLSYMFAFVGANQFNTV